MRLPDLRRFTLSLIGTKADTATAASLSADDWAIVDQIAEQHRLRPFLQARLYRGSLTLSLPVELQSRWRAAQRHSALQALATRKAVLDVQKLLGKKGLHPVALKGAWCAWHAYASAAERPMRDIDLLLKPEEALEAFHLLREHGFRQEGPSARTPEESLGHDKHLPPLVSPEGLRFELHMRLWERSEAIGWWMPEAEDAAMLDRALEHPEDGLRYLAPEDMLTHFVIHAVYSNRLNGGPLGLIDIDALLQIADIDWQSFWQRAEEGGWIKGAALALHLVDTWRRPGILAQAQCSIGANPAILASAPGLLLQDLSHRKTTGMAADLAERLRKEGALGLASAVIKRASGKERGLVTPEDSQGGAEKFSGWLTKRAKESARALADPDVRTVSREMTRMGQWLDPDSQTTTGSHGDEN